MRARNYLSALFLISACTGGGDSLPLAGDTVSGSEICGAIVEARCQLTVECLSTPRDACERDARAVCCEGGVCGFAYQLQTDLALAYVAYEQTDCSELSNAIHANYQDVRGLFQSISGT